eukprot:gb/GECH01009386.1/.p1 GENE.gb/GECH01009386.1/~~gb/GECH01009386.1/.p1  ORF type:complete len:101 (+),score=32.91 gb/GECH01009386.1/:1-303(+)
MWHNKIKPLFNNQFFKVGAPFLTVLIVSSFSLERFLSKTYEKQAEQHRVQRSQKKLKKAFDSAKEDKKDLEEERQEILEKYDTSKNFENKKVPRPPGLER